MPALFTMLSYLEHEFGIYHVKGGLNRIAAAMAKVITEQGGTIHTGTPIESLIIENKVVKGVRLADGTAIEADEVIVNADFAHAMTHLVKADELTQHSPEKLKKMEYSCSTFMLYLGLNKRYDISHHNIVFANDYTTNVANIFRNKTLSRIFHFTCKMHPSLTTAWLQQANQRCIY